jgi:hypothetical protein
MMGPAPARFKPAAVLVTVGPECRPGGPAGVVAVSRAEAAAYSTALTMSSTTFFASPKTIIVLSM